MSQRSRVQNVDRYVGARMREQRIMLGLTQQQMAQLIGVTYQQAHKYEKGVNRVTAGRLYRIAQALGVSIDYFFEGYDGEYAGVPKATPRRRLLLELAQNFMSLEPGHKQAISALTRSLAGNRGGES